MSWDNVFGARGPQEKKIIISVRPLLVWCLLTLSHRTHFFFFFLLREVMKLFFDRDRFFVVSGQFSVPFPLHREVIGRYEMAGVWLNLCGHRSVAFDAEAYVSSLCAVVTKLGVWQLCRAACDLVLYEKCCCFIFFLSFFLSFFFFFFSLLLFF